jgi:hypothetical protein
MNKLIVALLAVISLTVNAKEIGEVTNKAGGKTILTDANCTIDDNYLYGLAINPNEPPTSFCWDYDKKTEAVNIYLPLNNVIQIPAKSFKDRDDKTDPKPTNVI